MLTSINKSQAKNDTDKDRDTQLLTREILVASRTQINAIFQFLEASIRLH